MVPNGWNTKPLADIVKEKISYGIVQAGPHVPDGIPYIKSSDVRGTINPDALQRTSQEIHFKYRRSSVHPGDIVFSLRGNIGESAIVPASLPEANLTQGTARISVSVEHSNLFHYYQLASEKILNRVNALSKGSTFKEISLEELRKVKVLCAPLPEQKKIAQILSTWDKAITTTEQLLANSQQQKKALMQQLLTGQKRLLDNNGVRFSGEWRETHLRNVSVIVMGASPKSSAYNETGDGMPLIQGNADIKHRLSTPRVHTSEITKKCSHGDILLSVRAPVGNVAISQHEACIGRGISSIKAKSNESQDFLYQWLLWFEPRWGSLSQGSTFESINSDDIKSLKMKIPYLEEQQKIAAVLSTADQEISALQQKLDALKQEKKALMQQLLTGKRRVLVS
ncbi:restriction endonuclease subunit S [Vibrio vulnificus]|uniref:restriction endonuclease subunit S n=1 Tax=Vibrio vulnificus TaxID=672 RepID=UPI00102A4E3F|nr:restriction endonuclease subunit S [Vibrio vulnificus]EGQ7957387.1 restriction endonuclease subunit S [Vibrio vulnificus]EGQ7988199.1 restriction endonuclease subunit S [Vibrio vulnificus]EGQ9239557.1 restriction endonuclease subunit S [Vibrio vulnificus]EGR7963117.1 restriction endonuclease subunit S [Vibrio vulnificus]EGR7986125.1 restriction endonuclease subunit S [Vibrio vulnificus]